MLVHKENRIKMLKFILLHITKGVLLMLHSSFSHYLRSEKLHSRLAYTLTAERDFYVKEEKKGLLRKEMIKK